MPPVAAAVSPVRKSRVEKHGRELAVGGSAAHGTGPSPDATETAPSAGSASSASYAETAPPAESPPIRQRQEQNKATPPVLRPEGLPHFIHRLSE